MARPILTDIHYCSFVPPHVLRNIAEHGDEEDRLRARTALAVSSDRRRERQSAALVAGIIVFPRRVKRRTIFDAQHEHDLPGRTIRIEGSARVRDVSVNEAYDFTGMTYDYFRRVHRRRSLDDRGLRLESSVHFGDAFNNAHWNGRQMIYGDGDGKYFRRFTSSLDVVAHELTHGVTQYASGLGFSGQCGALAEHFSDVFGILVKQYAQRQSAARADWLVGAGLFTDRVQGEALRSMKAPGSAYDDPILGRDPQPAHMRDYVITSGDHRGVHVNSGIPNHAFYLVATALGGNAWQTAGQIWYRALTQEIGPRSGFQHCADATSRAAALLFGGGSEPQSAVIDGWSRVGVDVSQNARAAQSKARRRSARPAAFDPPTGAAELPLIVA